MQEGKCFLALEQRGGLAAGEPPLAFRSRHSHRKLNSGDLAGLLVSRPLSQET